MKMDAGTSASIDAVRRARRRVINRVAAVVAAVFMLVIADAQLASNGARSLANAEFIGLDLGLGIVMLVMGTWIGAVFEVLTRSRRERRDAVERVIGVRHTEER